MRLAPIASSVVILSLADKIQYKIQYNSCGHYGCTTCISLPDGDTSNGALLQMSPCGQSSQQEWSFQDGQLVYLLDPTKCADLLGGDTTNGNRLGIWDCYGGDSQQFAVNPDLSTIYMPNLADSGKCVWSAEKGGPVSIWDCNLDSTQEWTIGSTSSQTTPFV